LRRASLEPNGPTRRDRSTRAPRFRPPISRSSSTKYAPRFDAHLTQALPYPSPATIAEALDAVAPASRFTRALDLGCDAGLIARPFASASTTSHFSPATIEKAWSAASMTRLSSRKATALLGRRPPAAIDLIVAADSLV
jgi:predicted TPR repeat methyltransferase